MSIYTSLTQQIITQYRESGRTFEPTYLYIKQHSITGKLYFGKTVKNPEKYNGSGSPWR